MSYRFSDGRSNVNIILVSVPAKITGVRCLNERNGLKKLTWNGCGNGSIEYTITWSKDNVFFKPKSTFETFFDFIDLQPGKYEFRVSAGGGKSSESLCVLGNSNFYLLKLFMKKMNLLWLCNLGE